VASTLPDDEFKHWKTYTVALAGADTLESNALTGAPVGWHLATAAAHVHRPHVVQGF